jgi:hypothetical protein
MHGLTICRALESSTNPITANTVSNLNQPIEITDASPPIGTENLIVVSTDSNMNQPIGSGDNNMSYQTMDTYVENTNVIQLDNTIDSNQNIQLPDSNQVNFTNLNEAEKSVLVYM